MRATGTLVGLGLIATLAGRAAAQSTPAVSVTRGPGAEECPDSSGLLVRIEQLRGRPEAGATVAYHVAFTHENSGFCAEIRSLADAGGARTLCDAGQTCAALEQAAAVTLALLLDSDARASKPPDAAVPPVPPPVRVASPSAAVAAQARDADPSPVRAQVATKPERGFTLALGGASLLGVVQPIVPTLAAELGLRASRFRTGLGVLWAPALARDFGPGTVSESLWSGVARACMAPLVGSALRLDLCSGLYVGALRAEARGYTQNDAATRVWLALPVELALASTPSPLGWELSAAVLVPLRRQDFSIDNVGVAYASLPLGVLIALRGVALWPW